MRSDPKSDFNYFNRHISHESCAKLLSRIAYFDNVSTFEFERLEAKLSEDLQDRA